MIVMGASPFRIVRGDGQSPSDAEIAEALRRGDRAAELEAWNRFSPGTAETLRRLLGPGPDREDLLQEVYLRFFRNVGRCASRPRSAASWWESACTW